VAHSAQRAGARLLAGFLQSCTYCPTQFTVFLAGKSRPIQGPLSTIYGAEWAAWLPGTC